MYMASLASRRLSDVAMPKVVAKVLEEIGVHGNLIAAISAEMQGATRFSGFRSLPISYIPGVVGREAWTLRHCSLNR